VIIRKGVTRVQLSNILFEFETAKHLSAPGVETFPVTAFKLEPLTPSGHLTLDGELIDYGPIEAEVLQGCARLMTK
jgi:sphingosine kinase